jgi:hypothetical protein
MLRLHLITGNYLLPATSSCWGWNSQLTQGNRGLAEDLLHEVYVPLSIHEADINRAQNGSMVIFYRYLRNLWVSHVCRTMRVRFQQCSIIEYESAETGLRTIDPYVGAGREIKKCANPLV